MSILQRLAFTLCLAGSLSQTGLSQDLLYSFDAHELLYPNKLLALGDVDGDGVGDLAQGMRSIQDLKRVEVFSGKDGAALYAIGGPPGTQIYGHLLCALDDHNGDGILDFASVGAQSGDVNSPLGVLDIFSGADGSLLARHDSPAETTFLEFPAPITLDDVDGDGKRDLLISIFAPNQPRLQAFSTATGQALYTLAGDPDRAVGPAVVLIDDLDLDGIAEFAVSAIKLSSAESVLEIHSGASGATLLSHFVPVGFDVSPMSTVADLDLDGKREVASGSIFEGLVRIYSPVSGALLLQLDSVTSDISFGSVTLDAGDLDFDGSPDVLVAGVRSPGVGRLEARSLSDGHTIFELDGPAGACCFGAEPTFLAGADPEGFFSFATLHPDSSPWPTTYVYRYAPAIGQNYCTPTDNSTGAPALIEAQGTSSIALDFLVLAGDSLPAQQFGIFFYGPSQQELPFGNGLLCVAPGTTGLGRLPVERANAAGRIFHRLDYANPPSNSTRILPGSLWHFQIWFRDPMGGGAAFDLSDALSLSFVP